MLFQKGHKINVGKKRTPEQLAKISWKGKKRGPMSEEQKLKVSLAKKGKRASQKTEFTQDSTSKEKHWNWKGGVSKINKIIRRCPEYLQWRSNIFNRDLWTCQTCKAKGFVVVHHIKGFAEIVKENEIKSLSEARNCASLWDELNGVTLCETCHSLTDNFGNKRAIG